MSFHNKINVLQDRTDHLVYQCRLCKGLMNCEQLTTDKIAWTKCTTIEVRCVKCNDTQWKKFYWNYNKPMFTKTLMGTKFFTTKQEMEEFLK